MNWHVYKKDNPNTWPQCDCPMVVYGGVPFYRNLLDIFKWDNTTKNFIYSDKRVMTVEECYYAYIGYVPSGYKTCYPIICTCKNCPEGYDDNGYCMDYDNEYACGYKKEVEEYSIEQKRIWKEFK